MLCSALCPFCSCRRQLQLCYACLFNKNTYTFTKKAFSSFECRFFASLALPLGSAKPQPILVLISLCVRDAGSTLSLTMISVDKRRHVYCQRTISPPARLASLGHGSGSTYITASVSDRKNTFAMSVHRHMQSHSRHLVLAAEYNSKRVFPSV